jgi:hypothetical protein
MNDLEWESIKKGEKKLGELENKKELSEGDKESLVALKKFFKVMDMPNAIIRVNKLENRK